MNEIDLNKDGFKRCWRAVKVSNSRAVLLKNTSLV